MSDLSREGSLSVPQFFPMWWFLIFTQKVDLVPIMGQFAFEVNLNKPRKIIIRIAQIKGYFFLGFGILPNREDKGSIDICDRLHKTIFYQSEKIYQFLMCKLPTMIRFQ